MELSPNAVYLAIRSIDAEIVKLLSSTKDGDISELDNPDDQQYLADLSQAAHEFEMIYREMCKKYTNMIPYGQLITRTK